ncbi:pyrimidine 5'-nucleotidase [Ferrimonas balearica]|uniref:pyrimidine 5'-nucleotidase n=1 Tax=Ferrimonas balearica TaxID=44012 RepID=UPI001C9A2B0D|nr:pyrimidine 5'-nucleotidase [Ferrimonas balearica]MBY5921038.1 pyrimidine 5'-nucleotidase [Ferrimonas balearica]MBY5996277.1 pyrimidine 5'-nucleotidase [Ferrimonas balearica]
MPYQWILFDADETLFHFDALAGLKRMFSHHGVTFSDQNYREYQAVNQPLWQAYNAGEIDAKTLQSTRFDGWAAQLGTTGHQLNSDFLQAMADICAPLPGVRELIDTLAGKARLGIITNGFTELQSIRLERTGLAEAFELVVISEEVGITKPHAGIFQHALEMMGQPDKQQVLMVGDNLHTDILGGFNAGLNTCWYNPSQQEGSAEITPHFEIQHHDQLRQRFA